MTTRAGQPYGHTLWAAKINQLAAKPTPQMIQFFDEKFGKAGYSGREILAALHDGGAQQEPAAEPQPAATAPAGDFEMAGP